MTSPTSGSLSLPDRLPASFALRARYVFARDMAAPTPDAWLIVHDGRVTEVKPGTQPASAAQLPGFDLGNVAVIPGLTNTHTHLEFSDLRQPLGQSGMPLPDWIRLVMRQRTGAKDGSTDSSIEDTSAALRTGVNESLASGVTRVGEIATANWNAAAFSDAPLEVTAFRELIATDPELVHQRIQAAEESPPWSIAHCDDNVTTLLPGLSPHAPYSTSLELVRTAVARSTQHGWPVAMHLAESPEEMEYMASGGGPFRQLLEDLGVWNANAMHPPLRPLDYLRILAEAPHAYVIHGNFLQQDELRVLAEHRERMTLVYCPRTHAYFGHPPHPIRQAMSQGVRIAIGTDSRASNPNLNLFEELQFLAMELDLPGREVLAWGTQALSSTDKTANREPKANLAVVQLAEANESDAYRQLFNEKSRIAATIIGSEIFHG